VGGDWKAAALRGHDFGFVTVRSEHAMPISGAADTMSDVLSLMRLRCTSIAVADHEGPFADRIAAAQAHVHLIQAGSAWFAVEGRPPLRLSAGDVVVLPRGSAHALTSLDALAGSPLAASAIDGGGGATVLSAGLEWEGVPPHRLADSLPPFIHVQAGADSEWAGALAGVLAEELEVRALGWTLLVSQLVTLLFLRAVSDWARSSPSRLGALRASIDPAIARALSAVNDNSASPWGVENLAAVAGLSRSAFHARFAAAVGETPARYVARRRLEIAAAFLRAGRANVGEIASLVGYGSEVAFTRAFKARFGATPSAFRARPEAAPETSRDARRVAPT
jgi:AraC-like DNA-binding protein